MEFWSLDRLYDRLYTDIYSLSYSNKILFVYSIGSVGNAILLCVLVQKLCIYDYMYTCVIHV